SEQACDCFPRQPGRAPLRESPPHPLRSAEMKRGRYKTDDIERQGKAEGRGGKHPVMRKEPERAEYPEHNEQAVARARCRSEECARRGGMHRQRERMRSTQPRKPPVGDAGDVDSVARAACPDLLPARGRGGRYLLTGR